MHFTRVLTLTALTAALLLATTTPTHGQGKKSEEVIKATAIGDKVGGDGKQLVTITLDVDPKYYIYANPPGLSDLESVQTTVKVTGKAPPTDVKIDYPVGELVKDAVVGDYKIYKGKVTIKAHVQRAAGDNAPLELAVKLQACDKRSCLIPSTIKINVP